MKRRLIGVTLAALLAAEVAIGCVEESVKDLRQDYQVYTFQQTDQQVKQNLENIISEQDKLFNHVKAATKSADPKALMISVKMLIPTMARCGVDSDTVGYLVKKIAENSTDATRSPLDYGQKAKDLLEASCSYQIPIYGMADALEVLRTNVSSSSSSYETSSQLVESALRTANISASKNVKMTEVLEVIRILRKNSSNYEPSSTLVASAEVIYRKGGDGESAKAIIPIFKSESTQKEGAYSVALATYQFQSAIKNSKPEDLSVIVKTIKGTYDGVAAISQGSARIYQASNTRNVEPQMTIRSLKTIKDLAGTSNAISLADAVTYLYNGLPLIDDESLKLFEEMSKKYKSEGLWEVMESTIEYTKLQADFGIAAQKVAGNYRSENLFSSSKSKEMLQSTRNLISAGRKYGFKDDETEALFDVLLQSSKSKPSPTSFSDAAIRYMAFVAENKMAMSKGVELVKLFGNREMSAMDIVVTVTDTYITKVFVQ